MKELDLPTLERFQEEHPLHQKQNSRRCSSWYYPVVETVESMADLHIQLDKVEHI